MLRARLLGGGIDVHAPDALWLLAYKPAGQRSLAKPAC